MADRAAARGNTFSFGAFHSSMLSNEGRSLDGHSAVSIFGNITVDLTAEPLPTAETKIYIYSIFSSLEVLVPNDVGIRITGVSLLSSLKVRGQEVGSGILSVNEYLTPGYELSARKLHIDLVLIFGSAEVRR